MRRGYTITKGALDLLESSSSPLEMLKKAMHRLEEDKCEFMLIDENLLREVLKTSCERSLKSETVEEVREAEEEAPVRLDNRLLREWRIGGSSQDFHKYFMSRYEKLSKILRSRLSGVIDIRSAMKLREGREAHIVAMLLEKRETGKAWILRVDDPTAEFKIIVPKVLESGEDPATLLPDSVFGARISRNGGSLIAREIVLPDVAAEQQVKDRYSSYVCLISDMHLGSKYFRDDLFESFLDWINRGRDSEAKRVRFIMIAGDLVDGVGVYPGQHKELEIFSVEEQFRKLSRLLSEVPEHVKIIAGPGNHDPVQKPLPQPPIHKKYQHLLEASGRRFIFIGNPAWINLGSRAFLVYHGQGLDDLIQNIPGLSYSSLSKNMGRLLTVLMKHRHLCPIYGENTPILPLEEDLLVMDKIPSVFHSGHVHVAYAGSYRGVKLVNSGTWQEQTSYQRSLGLEPTVGVMSLVNLEDLSVKIRRFM